jgi:hypothetical protein
MGDWRKDFLRFKKYGLAVPIENLTIILSS